MEKRFLRWKNPGAASLSSLPLLPVEEFRRVLVEAVRKADWNLASFFAVPERDGGSCRLIAVLTEVADGWISLTSARVTDRYDAITPECAQFQRFEREIYEQTGVLPEGHPRLKPIRFPGRVGMAADGVTVDCPLRGSAPHEVAVGPVHAGVIEPGHFRFQCVGEEVYSLEISLGYQHRGIEAMLRGGPDRRTLPIMETVAGDSSVASALAYCQILEALSPDCRISRRSQALRAIALELERIANHVGDLGALAGDTAYLPTASYCGRIRGEFLNMTAELCGNRFGRGLITPDGIGFPVDSALLADLRKRLDRTAADLRNALELMFDSPSVLDRLENTGFLSKETAKEIGLVGVAARASGVRCDIRSTHPSGFYRIAAPALCSVASGDVFARAEVRRLELKESLRFIRELIENLPEEGEKNSVAPDRHLPPDSIAVSLVESWRGELCHTALTTPEGRFLAYKIVDPSFHNWFGLAMALRGEQISNFPLCNKSFNLSYCGHDL